MSNFVRLRIAVFALLASARLAITHDDDLVAGSEKFQRRLSDAEATSASAEGDSFQEDQEFDVNQAERIQEREVFAESDIKVQARQATSESNVSGLVLALLSDIFPPAVMALGGLLELYGLWETNYRLGLYFHYVWLRNWALAYGVNLTPPKNGGPTGTPRDICLAFLKFCLGLTLCNIAYIHGTHWRVAAHLGSHIALFAIQVGLGAAFVAGLVIQHKRLNFEYVAPRDAYAASRGGGRGNSSRSTLRNTGPYENKIDSQGSRCKALLLLNATLIAIVAHSHLVYKRPSAAL